MHALKRILLVSLVLILSISLFLSTLRHFLKQRTVEQFEAKKYCTVQLNIHAELPNYTNVQKLAARLRTYASLTDAVQCIPMLSVNISGMTIRETQAKLERDLFPFLKYKSALVWRESFKPGRGLAVAVASKHMQFMELLIENLRLVGSTLPIEVIYKGSELKRSDRTRLRKLGVEKLVNILDLVDNSKAKIDGFAIKPFALLFSSYSETILVDADAQFFHKPELLFKNKGYEDTGALFYLDRYYTQTRKNVLGPKWFDENMLKPLSAQIQKLQIYQGKSNEQMESGVVLIDKSRNLYATLAACRLQLKEERDAWFARIFWGDKEAFWLAFELLNMNYFFHQMRPGVIGSINPNPITKVSEVCGNVVHPGDDGRPFWWNGGMVAKFNDSQKVIFQAFSIEGKDDTSRAIDSCLEKIEPVYLNTHELTILKLLETYATAILNLR